VEANEIEYKWVGLHSIVRSSSTEELYEAYFSTSGPKALIQVGANDGIMCDPLRRFLVDNRERNLQAVLIEPIPFYFDKLKSLYAGYPNVSVINVACGAKTGRAPIFFIEPSVADQMNGSGPPNNWAHGQGSFDKSVVKYWIDRNRFRGEGYVNNIQNYYASIRSVDVPVVRLADIELPRTLHNVLVAIDVQGSELDVIKGIDWNHPPTFIVFEDDLNKATPIDRYLRSKGYTHLCGMKEKVYVSRLVARGGIIQEAARGSS